jgi:hypothetical protein
MHGGGGGIKPIIRPPINARPIVPASTPLLGPSAINLKPIQPRPTIMADSSPLHLEALEELRRSKKEQKIKKKENSTSPGTSPPRNAVNGSLSSSSSKQLKEHLLQQQQQGGERKTTPPAKSPDAYSDISDDNDDSMLAQKQKLATAAAAAAAAAAATAASVAATAQGKLPSNSAYAPPFPFSPYVLPPPSSAAVSPQLPTVPVSTAAMNSIRQQQQQHHLKPITTSASEQHSMMMKTEMKMERTSAAPALSPAAAAGGGGGGGGGPVPGSLEYQKMMQAYGFPPFPYPIPPGMDPNLHVHLLTTDATYKAKYERERGENEKAFKEKIDREQRNKEEAAAAIAAAKRRDSITSNASSSSSLSVKPEFKEERPLKTEEGAKPTMETRGPPPGNSAFAGGYMHPSMLRPGTPGGAGFPPGMGSPFGPGGINPLLLSEMYANHYLPPQFHQAMRHPSFEGMLRPPFMMPPTSQAQAAASSSPVGLPEDLSRVAVNQNKALEMLQQHAHFYNQHKIHELQERAIKSPNSSAAASGKSSPKTSSSAASSSQQQQLTAAAMVAAAQAAAQQQHRANVSKSTPPPPSHTMTMAMAGLTSPSASKASPPPQRHLHTHTHTHFGLGYPLLQPPTGSSGSPSPGAPPAAHNPFPPTGFPSKLSNDFFLLLSSINSSITKSQYLNNEKLNILFPIS